MSELKPCPFCGGSAHTTVRLVICDYCGARTQSTNAAAAEALWNRRAPEAPVEFGPFEWVASARAEPEAHADDSFRAYVYERNASIGLGVSALRDLVDQLTDDVRAVERKVAALEGRPAHGFGPVRDAQEGQGER